MTTAPKPLEAERSALRHILARLMEEETDLDTLCKLAPRLISVSANVVRIEASLTQEDDTDDLDRLRKTLRDLETDSTTEETDQW